MISSAGYKKVKIQITTFQKEDSKKRSKKRMDKEKYRQSLNESNRRYICAVCSNSNNQHICNDCGRLAKPCPICRKADDIKNDKRSDNTKKPDNKNALFHTYDHKTFNSKVKDKPDACNRTHVEEKEVRSNEKNAKRNNIKTDNTKTVQTSQTDLTQDLSLLKEVLTVFQSKKQMDIKSNNTKTVVMKDVSVATEAQSNLDLKPKLTKSRIFQLSIGEVSNNNNNDFKVVNCCQPSNKKSSHYSIDLIKHKSSSIPQMKLEELKYSLKEKTKSKDAIEEVNRMFATVRRHEKSKTIEYHNRPLVRNGPRVLPVVKTNTYQENAKENSESEMENKAKDETICKCCQTNNLQLSAGDSFFKHECCYHKMLHEGKCEKCVYMLCCHYQNHRKIETGALVCEHCRKVREGIHDVTGEINHCDHF
ncbi:hypothetical protein ABMA27_011035 [Loxostege sticticalis]|uniref:Uncharacterized protein n=1 Tax=Loxostege sticticalis TaxID=481309 RepID=A0ABR3H341_LOXSC